MIFVSAPLAMILMVLGYCYQNFEEMKVTHLTELATVISKKYFNIDEVLLQEIILVAFARVSFFVLNMLVKSSSFQMLIERLISER